MDWVPPWPQVEGALRTLMLPAFAAAAAVLAITCAVTKRPGLRMAGGVLALVAGLAAGNYFRELLDWWPRQTPPDEPPERALWWALARGWPALLPVTTAALALGLLAELLPGRVPGILLRMLTAAGVAGWMTEALEPFSKTATFGVLFAGMVLNHEALLFAAGRTLGRTSLFMFALPWGSTAATVLIFAHSARFADLAGLMMASVAGAGAIAVILKLESRALFAAPAAFFPPLLLAGKVNLFGEVPTSAFACAAFAPCALWLLCLPAMQRCSPRAFAVAAVIAICIPCAVAVGVAVWYEDLSFGE
jgi:hypothetical protein